ncbi:MAG: hypothetical protein KAT32_00870 [Candidatus Moranbacteria bacterium]|nr:hypothetical protein [Candidatus Moranbacteria bacterium]
MRNYFRNLVSFFVKNERRIVVGFGIFLITLISFTFGIMKGKGISQEPLVISMPEVPPVIINSSESSAEEKNKIGEVLTTCIYVGSKKGSKYYPPTCSYAEKIISENLRCFSSDEDAVNKGYTKTSSCD